LTKKNKLKYKIPLVLDGFNPLTEYNSNELRYIDPNSLNQLNFEMIDAQYWYNEFRDRVVSSINNKYLPVYRMADGEFWFCTRFLESMNIREKLKLILKSENKFQTIWKEQYSESEVQAVRMIFMDSLKFVSDNGILAIHFIDNTYSALSKDMLKWFDKNQIVLNKDNYTSFYFVYALLTGIDRLNVFEDRNLLIITHFDDMKKEKIASYLDNIGCKSVQFYNISASKSMLEKIDLQKILAPVDVVLIGAGVGSVNILKQLNSLKTLCIDAGIILEVFANPELSNTRIFLSNTYK